MEGMSVTPPAPSAETPAFGRLALAGDWHGAGEWGATVVEAVAAAGLDTLHHVGDFGIWPGRFGEEYLATVEAACAAHGVTLWITPGNHEDWDRLDALFAATPDAPSAVSPHISVLPPAFRWEFGGRRFLSLGGAPTLSFERRTVGVDWWPSEELTEADVEKAIAGGATEVMIGHDGPEGGTDAAAQMIASNPFGFSARAQAYADVGRERFTRAFLGVRPRFLAHGHYHAYGMNDRMFGAEGSGDGEAGASGSAGSWPSRILTLDREKRIGNAVVLDLADYTVRALPVELPA